MRQHASPELLDAVWKTAFLGQIPDKLVIVEELVGNVIQLEGHELVAVDYDRPLYCMSLVLPFFIKYFLDIPFMVVYSCKKCGEPNFLTPHAFWNITDFGAKCEKCETIIR